MTINFSGKNALITGASRGFGRALALGMAKRGAHIIALSRTQGGLTELDDAIKKETGSNATLIPFDLSGPEANFAVLGQTLFERFKSLDVLALNAATLGTLGPVAHMQDKDLHKVFATNLLANIRLLRVFEPMLRNTKNPLVLFATCRDEAMGNAYWGPYAASKKALEEIALSYEQETKNAGTRVRLFDPGVMATKLRADALPGEDQSTLPTPESIAEAMLASEELWA